MSRPDPKEVHREHEFEAVIQRRVARTAAHETEVRRLTEERWQRRIMPLLSNPDAVETDFGGCFG